MAYAIFFASISFFALVMLKLSAAIRESYLLWLKLTMHFVIWVLFFAGVIKSKMARGYRPVSNEMEQKFSPIGKKGVFNL
jgi:hypothetical protein